MASRPLVVLSDAHLAPGDGRAVSCDLAQLVANHSRAEILLNGDTFTLSGESSEPASLQALGQLLDGHADLRSALRGHLAAGSPVTLIAGNHDAALMAPASRELILGRLELIAQAPLSVEPWFVRRNRLHIEHGHVYDRDNAPTHPLARWSLHSEPLGIALTRRFVVPNRAWGFAHAHETTFARGLWQALRWYGLRGPAIVARYYTTATVLWLEAGRESQIAGERAVGDQAVGGLAQRAGVPVECVRELLRAAPPPTHHRRWDMFMRLYLDRSLALLVTASAGALLAGPAPPAGLAAGVVGAGYLTASVLRSGNRYRGQLGPDLRAAAQRVAAVSGAECVVFGHSHREDEAPHYVNTGAFSCPTQRGRPYLVVDSEAECGRRRWQVPSGSVG
jgi:hypothetical protein